MQNHDNRPEEEPRVLPSEIAAAGFIALVATMFFFWAMGIDPVQSQTIGHVDLNNARPVECMSCLTDPANSDPATKDDVRSVNVRVDTNVERITVLTNGHNQVVDAVTAQIAKQERENRERLAEIREQRQLVDDAIDLADRRFTEVDQSIDDVAALAGVGDTRALDDMRDDIDQIDRSAKRRDAAILVTDIPDVQVGENFALDVMAGTVGGETAFGVGMASSFDAPAISSRVVFGASASTDSSGKEQAFVGKAGLRF